MAKVTIATGIILMLLGIGFYIGVDGSSFTALIPAMFGLPILAFGLVARDEFKRKHAMHAAVLFGLLGFLGSFGMGFPKWRILFSGGEIPLPLAAWEQLAMAIICGIFVALCVQSFIAARKTRNEPQRREDAESGES